MLEVGDVKTNWASDGMLHIWIGGPFFARGSVVESGRAWKAGREDFVSRKYRVLVATNRAYDRSSLRLRDISESGQPTERAPLLTGDSDNSSLRRNLGCN